MKYKIAAGVLLAFVIGVQAPAQAKTGSACSNYVYAGTNISLCRDFPGDSDRDCKDIGYKVGITGTDPWHLSQGGQSKIGCESKPKYPKPSPTPTKSTPPTSPTVKPTHTATPTKNPTTPPTTATPTKTATARPTSTRTTSATPVPAGPTLPVTGPRTGILAVLGATVLAAGAFILRMTRSRRRRFVA